MVKNKQNREGKGREEKEIPVLITGEEEATNRMGKKQSPRVR